MTDDEIISVVQAHKEGKKIESKWNRNPKSTDWELMKWHECSEPTWDFGYYEYRVAPEPRKPREWICLMAADGTITPVNKPITPELLLASKTIRVREVI